MPVVTLIFSALLILLAAVGYFGAAVDDRSVTSLIPAFVGIPLALCGLVALKDSLRKHAMHGAVMFGLLGALASGGRALQGGFKMMQGGDVNQRAYIMVLIMAVICITFVVLCVRSFIAARKRQQAGTSLGETPAS